ncbi:hypothetical protein TVAG_193630 [Trichomonas vaginalis G3]|uniref:KATNIP domain-containing protein n=1 Tax=Trichomonas vaginalis (strain ATCC PRA-98 / G3) TaxID=412133 RepID=A2EVL4_TRIV3|nr:hypothetical protein TVAGG3_0357940 [Trichomonas vaginalis G3]EAY03293.1 hypothetical protein TVAG_193630 [Trichomonas vaginalis G3]KAI5531747.1 hypothetical protein TVAGG3_0357940 [Trichomonas vaginalis G3]|eukprot:XP_001315516.1 hypothetical protein [Trichomonas vaginalis G3]
MFAPLTRRASKGAIIVALGRKRAASRPKHATASATFSPQKITQILQEQSTNSKLSLEKAEIHTSNSDFNLDYALTKKITIKFLSNWGNVPKISSGDIAVLDKDKISLEITDMVVYPKEMTYLLPNLDPSKSLKMFAWHSAFDAKDPIEITFFTSSNARYVRFINSGIDKETALKDLEIYENDNLAFKGETHRDFGIVAMLDSHPVEKVSYEHNLNLQRWDALFKDSYGFVPQFTGNLITIRLRSNYGNPEATSISHVVFFDTSEKPIPVEYFSTDRALKQCIFDNPRKFQTIENQVIFANTDKNVPQIDISVVKPIAIGGVCVFNTSLPDIPTNQCTKVFEILLNGVQTYIGKIPQSDGLPRNQKQSMTRVFLSDMNKRFVK